ncbi:DUF2314 domain-containing protein [Thalassococcus lentus]|uniref:DUF2314 domain-containing protein n=1 Tax=Thalassococcus lentus TaxID=1210524 RepID=A0ABT4XTD1_9RHOB|nr:DUF2314 domain-containing protein [Thalassococcus lentus]MDA7425226.1 DUF2314 domain-containing protein [Thalassococcus lentus]
MSVLRLLSCAVLAGHLALLAVPSVQAEMRVIKVVTYDHALAEAFAEARGTLNTVIGAMQKRRGWFSPSLSFRVALHVSDDPTDVELVWVDNLRRRGNGFEGRLASHPQKMPGKRMGSKVTFLHPQIADWAVQAEDGRYYGYFTTRVSLKYMSDAEAREVEAILVPKAVPDLWYAMAKQAALPEDTPRHNDDWAPAGVPTCQTNC